MRRPLAGAVVVLAAACAMPGPLTDAPAHTGDVAAASVPVFSRGARAPRTSRTHVRPAVRATPTSRRTPPPRGSRPGGPTSWGAVARCESGGHWHHHTSKNGYWGGLQESPRFWASYGGLRYAPRPDLASVAQQIAVAARGLRAQGWRAWPTCGRYR